MGKKTCYLIDQFRFSCKMHHHLGLRISSTLFLALLSVSHQAVQENSCPSPCRCLFFEGLWSVYCNRTGIYTIPPNIPLSTQLLDLNGNQIKAVGKRNLTYLTNLENLDLSSNGLNDRSIESGALGLPKLQTVDLSGNQFSSIPKTLPSNITTLYFLQNNLRTLRHDSFNAYSLLSYVDLSYCGLNVIEDHTFDSLHNLIVLYIPFNNLSDQSFPPKFLMKNTKLTLLGLRFNHLRQFLKGLPMSLQHLDYVGNNIDTIPSLAFQSLPNLQTLELWNGQVTTIEDNAFYGLSSLTILDMMSDKVSSTITNRTFNGLTGLQTLYFDENQVSEIQPMAFSSFQNITSLWFSGNNLTSLLDTKFIPHLSELYIDFNPWHCDCHLRWLREKVDNASYVIQDPHLITCASPPKVAGKAWDVLKPSDFVCN